MVLQDDRNFQASGNGLVVLHNALVVGHRLGVRRDHYRLGAEFLGHLREFQRGASTAVAGTNDHRHFSRSGHGVRISVSRSLSSRRLASPRTPRMVMPSTPRPPMNRTSLSKDSRSRFSSS